MYRRRCRIIVIVNATDFKAKCLALIEEMNRTQVPIIVTKRGERVAEMYPSRSEAETVKPFIGLMKDSVLYYHDPFAPVLDEGEWEVLK